MPNANFLEMPFMKISLKTLMTITLSGVFASGVFFFAGVCRAQSAVPADAQGDVKSLQAEIERLKDEKAFEAKRVEEMRVEREQFVKEIRRVESLNQKYTKEIESVRAQLLAQQDSFEARLKKMEADMVSVRKVPQEQDVAIKTDTPSFMDIEKKANEVFMKGGDLDPEDEKFKEELARAHYNMGNVYFERGEYQRAVVEYYQAVDLLPYDPDAHYNLAFVSGEFLGDQSTALKHYQWYLYLKPDARDRKLVEEKMVVARLHSRSKVDSRIDKPEQTGHQNIAR